MEVRAAGPGAAYIMDLPRQPADRAPTEFQGVASAPANPDDFAVRLNAAGTGFGDLLDRKAIARVLKAEGDIRERLAPRMAALLDGGRAAP